MESRAKGYVKGLIGRNTRKGKVIRMAKDTITLALNGDVTLADFSIAITEFLNLVQGLKADVAPREKIDWMITELQASSAIATVKGNVQEVDDLAGVERIVDAYVDLGQSLKDQKRLSDYSSVTQKAARRLFGLVNGRIRSIRFETAERDVELFKLPELKEEAGRVVDLGASHGAVRGRVDTLTRHNQLRFTLYDMIDDRAISCYLSPGSEEIMREAWGKIAVVEGVVRRDPETGHATTVRQVKSVHVVPEESPNEWRKAIGAAPGFLGATLPEDVIRRARDD